VPLSREDTDYIRHAYLEGVKRGRRDVGYMGEKLEGAIGFSIAHVDKYSTDQTAWAARRFAGPGKLIGADFQRYFPHGPEDGQETCAGNIFVNAGLSNLVALWTGLTAAGALSRPMGGTLSVCGVGTGTAAAANTDTVLIGDSAAAGAYYQGFDSAAAFGTTATPGQLVGTSTFGSAFANFAWNEWCWATGAGAITAGSSLSGTTLKPFTTANTAAMVNHKTAVALGTKASGSSWVFSTTFTIS
jgi:hypothetical protein